MDDPSPSSAHICGDDCPPTEPRRLAQRVAVVPYACICMWDPTPSGYVMTQRAEFCVVHRDPNQDLAHDPT